MSNNFSKYLSYVLRHNPSELELVMNDQGYVSIEELITNLKRLKGEIISREDLEKIVIEDKKGRYKIEDDKIRANQGHSVDFVHIAYKEYEGNGILYHGTSKKAYEEIKKSGKIKSMSRQYVHLSKNTEVATRVGKRHSHEEEPVIIEVDADAMKRDGIKLYESDNGVVLVKEVGIEYFR